MIPWKLLDSAAVPRSSEELQLYQRGDELSIKLVGGGELMNSRLHGSEESLAELACGPIRERTGARVLVGGMGMGFTLRAALDEVGEDAEVVVAELVPAVVRWNREHLGHFAGHPLEDPRASVFEGDVGALMREQKGGFDAIMLDVDNGPEGLTRDDNNWLYRAKGLKAAHAALRPKGVLTVWSAGPEPVFTDRLRRAGFLVEVVQVPARKGPSKGKRKRGTMHTIWVGVRRK